jgi:hypothetical protein
MFDTIKSLVDYALNGGAFPLDLPVHRRSAPAQIIAIAPTKPANGSIGRILVEKVPEPYWRERGWAKVGEEYVGFYKTRLAVCDGKIRVSPAGYCTIYIYNPPASVRKHPKWICFHRAKGGWYRVNTVTECCDVSSAILEVEKIIKESHEDY